MKIFAVIIPLLFLGNVAIAQVKAKKDSIAQVKAKEDSTKYWFNKKLETEHRRDSLKKIAAKKQPVARPKKTTKAKSQ